MDITTHHRGERAIFLEALDLPGEARPAFVEQACSTNAGLRHRVLDLLAAHDRAGNYLAGDPSVPGGASSAAPPDAMLGAVIGSYTLVERIGEGGFGLVYAAQQQEPLRRTVAIKLLKPGVDTEQVVARFQSERQTLALMDHPGIARIFDAGASQAGRPYFVMELVEGEPITLHCDRRRLTTAQRIELFIDVCSAVQHAHQKGVVHRDLKPSNVLVACDGAAAVAKVIDFGISKVVGSALGASRVHTESWQLVGTPAYMSPEQSGMTGAGCTDIDTRADIYALGVMLYELLTGSTPLDPEELRGADLGEVQRMIREQTPPPPSVRLTSLGLVGPAVAEARCTDPVRLQRILRGDLDWIVMKAIEKDRARRYESAAALADDLRRHLRNEPVEARAPSAAYRTAKFMRRHRVPVAAGACIAVALVAGLALAVAGLVHASRERDGALAARGRERAAREQAERMAERARVRSDFIAWGLGFGADGLPTDRRRDGLTVREMLDVASGTIDLAYAGAPQRRALARQQLGALYHTLFLNEDAQRELEAALDLWRTHPEGRDDEAMVAALRDLLYVHRDLTAPETVLDPLRHERAALDLAILERRAGPFGGEASPHRAAIAVLRGAVSTLLAPEWPGAARLEALDGEIRRALEDAAFPCDSEEFVLSVDAVVIAGISASTRWADPALSGQVVRLVEWLGERCPALARDEKAIAMLQLVAADLGTAIGLHELALRLCREAQRSLPGHLPPGHWIPLELVSMEGHLLGRLGRLDEAETLLLTGCQGLIESSHDSPTHFRAGVIRLLIFTAATGRTGLLERLQTPLRPLAAPLERLAAALGGGTREEKADAARALADALRASPRGAADPRPEAVASLAGLLEPYADSVSGDAARPCRELLAALSDMDVDQDPLVRGAMAGATWWEGVLLLTQSLHAEARARFQKVLDICVADVGTDSVWAHNCRRMIGRTMLAEGAIDEAATVLVRASEDMSRVATPTNIGVIAATRDAAMALAAAGREREAAPLLARQVRRMLEAEDACPDGERKAPPGYHLLVARPLALAVGLSSADAELAERSARRALAGLPDSGLARLTLGAALYRQQRHAEAESVLAEADETDRRLDRPASPFVALFRGASARASGRDEDAEKWRAEADRRAEQRALDAQSMRTWTALRGELEGAAGGK